MIANKRTKTRAVSKPVRFTAAEVERIERLRGLYSSTFSDVVRAGIGALEREHADIERKRREVTSSDTDG